MNCPECNRPMKVVSTDSGGCYRCDYCEAKWEKVCDICLQKFKRGETVAMVDGIMKHPFCRRKDEIAPAQAKPKRGRKPKRRG